MNGPKKNSDGMDCFKKFALFKVKIYKIVWQYPVSVQWHCYLGGTELLKFDHLGQDNYLGKINA